jgi:murein DD-endopeptidase MepM/ murein hydrolase activator NlpD
MGGYGNSLVLQHDFQLPAPGVLPSRRNPPPLPSSFWTSYNHLRERPALNPGDRVTIGQVIGYVGNTTNGQFAGMGAHLHFEVRKRAFPGSYNTDTVDPNVLWYSLGFTNPGARMEVQRTVGGDIVATPGGPSSCAPSATTLSGMHLQALHAGFGTAPVVEPPDYNPEPAPGVALPVPKNCPGGAVMVLPGEPCPGQSGGGAGIALVAGVLLFGWAVTR